MITSRELAEKRVGNVIYNDRPHDANYAAVSPIFVSARPDQIESEPAAVHDLSALCSHGTRNSTKYAYIQSILADRRYVRFVWKTRSERRRNWKMYVRTRRPVFVKYNVTGRTVHDWIETRTVRKTSRSITTGRRTGNNGIPLRDSRAR